MSMAELGETFDLHAGGEDLVFPHHENEIAQSEALTGKQFVRFWFHPRFLLVEGEKMSKSAGNFFTVRDLVLKGYKPSSIRFLLASVPYRNQLNFTFDGLRQAAASVERLRNFRARLTTAHLAAGAGEVMTKLGQETLDRMRTAMDDDLNTAQFQAAIFDMVRAANAAMDAGQVQSEDLKGLLKALETFDEVFGVIQDDDAAKIRGIVDWAKAEGREISAEALELAGSDQLSDAGIEKKITEMNAARAARNFAASDSLRAELVVAGILVENTKEGVRWRRK